MLKLENIHVFYGHVHALRGVCLEVPDSGVVALLGANGAGKSSTLRVISGLIHPKEGRYDLNGESMIGRSCRNVVDRKVIYCPEGRRVFPEFTVTENLQIGAYRISDRAQIRRDIDKVYEYFPRLRERMKQKAATLSGGEQQMLAIARSLMGQPKLLLLDEPSLGIAPKLSREIFGILKTINENGTAILLVEQNANLALKISNYAYVLENGKIGLEGRPGDIKKNTRMHDLYLGKL
ncbi:MAG: ABC transporter ATP-binding protein [Burkholderiaceae bacterium]|jgi:branched-chain amino acid transport system ATP-binding protein|nr:MAG: ABC transporter ATP-binding protein [Burkholderiaceae bacterium]